MSENKYEPPKKLRHGVYPFDVMTEYVRADLVDGLVEAVEKVLRISDRNHDAWYAARAALAALKEER